MRLPSSRASASSSGRSGYTSRAHAGVGHGAIVQLVVRSLTTLPASFERGEAIAPDARGVEVLHQPGSDRAGEPDARRADLPQREQALAVPVGDEVEVLLARVLDAGALDPRVEPLHVDELGAAAVRALRDRPDEVLLAGLAGDGDDLAGLHVGSEADDDVGEAAKRGVIHPAHLNRGVRCR